MQEGRAQRDLSTPPKSRHFRPLSMLSCTTPSIDTSRRHISVYCTIPALAKRSTTDSGAHHGRTRANRYAGGSRDGDGYHGAGVSRRAAQQAGSLRGRRAACSNTGSVDMHLTILLRTCASYNDQDVAVRLHLIVSIGCDRRMVASCFDKCSAKP